MPGLQRLGVGDVRPVQRAARADGLRGHRRPRRGDRRDPALRSARVQGAVPAVQARVRAAEPRGPQLQPARVRPAVGLHRRRRPADHVPRVHRARSADRTQPGWRGDQLHRPLARPDDGAARQHLRVRRRRTPSEPALRQHRGRHRLGGVDARGDGRGIPQAPHVGAAEVGAAAQRVLPPPGLRQLPGGQRRSRSRPRARPRRQLPVGQRLPPPRGFVAVLRPGDRAHDGRARRRGAGQDPRPQQRARSSSSRSRRATSTTPTRRRSRPAWTRRGRADDRPDVARQGRDRRYRRDDVLQARRVARPGVQAGAAGDPRARAHDAGIDPQRRRRLRLVQQRPQRRVTAGGGARAARAQLRQHAVGRRRRRRFGRRRQRRRGDRRRAGRIRGRLPRAGAGAVRPLRPGLAAPDHLRRSMRCTASRTG